MKKYFNIIFILMCIFCNGQNKCTINGNFSDLKNTDIELIGFNDTNDSIIETTKTNEFGKFSIAYDKKYIGSALIKVKNSNGIIVLLNQENIEINGTNFDNFEPIVFSNSLENENLRKGATIIQKVEKRKESLKNLLSLYKDEPLKLKWINNEINENENKVQQYFKTLPQNSYCKYYITIRKFITDIAIIAPSEPKQVPILQKQFNALNFNDNRLIHSGLYSSLLDSYFRLLENYDSSLEQTKISIDVMLKNLNSNPTLKQNIATSLFNFFEKRSLFKQAEYLALAMLDKSSCQMDDKHNALFEQYRKMAIGKTATDIVFVNSNSKIDKLSSITSKYKLVVFGSSHCNKCMEEFPKLNSYYNQWKTKHDLEMVVVALDTEKEKYEKFIAGNNWISSCDYKYWEGKAAIDYCVFATPTLYLLDNSNKILLKPIGAEQVNAWLNAYEGIK